MTAPSDDADHLLLSNESLRTLLGPLRIGLVEPDDFSGPAEQHVVALFQRQHAALCQIFGLVDDRSVFAQIMPILMGSAAAALPM